MNAIASSLTNLKESSKPLSDQIAAKKEAGMNPQDKMVKQLVDLNKSLSSTALSGALATAMQPVVDAINKSTGGAPAAPGK
jgi:hypothetical protein